MDVNGFCSPPLQVATKDGVFVLDMAAKIDATADYICKAKWGDVDFPPPFGREAYPEVRAVLENPVKDKNVTNSSRLLLLNEWEKIEN